MERDVLDTNTAHSERLVKHLGDDLRYARGLGWFVFGGRYWIQDDKEASQTAHKVKSLAQMFTLETNRLYEIADALECQNRESDAKAMKQAAAGHLALARKTESKRFIKDTLDLSAGAPAIRVEPPKFDVKPFVLGFENGVWDCGHWREHRREDYMMRLCPVVYDPDVDRVEWNAVLNRMTKGDVDFQRTLQDVAGYCLSGSSNLRCLPWFYGEKATGKSTFTELLQTVAGPLSATIDPLKFGEKADRDRLGALLWNCLVAVCGEAGNKKIDPELLKTLSGSDRLTVRHLYNEAFDAVPRHVLIMVSNDSPRLDAYDEALKDRILVLPFEHRLDAGGHLKFSSGTRIESVRKDPESLLVRGFLAWAIEGLARVFQTQTISEYHLVKEATTKFWEDTDPLTPFWQEVPKGKILKEGISVSEMRSKYQFFCEEDGTFLWEQGTSINQWNNEGCIRYIVVLRNHGHGLGYGTKKIRIP